MSLVFESSRNPPFLAEEGYPPIDQAGDEVDRFDEAHESHVSVAMNDVGDVSELAAAVAVSYHAPEPSILVESDPARLVVDDVVGGVGEEHHHPHAHQHAHQHPHPHQAPSSIAATAAAASAAAQTHAKAKASMRQASHDSSMSPPHSMANDDASPPISGSVRTRPIPKPDRNAYRNAHGKFQCTYPDCTEEVREFTRKCEFNKHMDKHERPYRCTAEGCDKLPGFTYSGGLLRHEREVHNKHGGPRNPLHCPHATCKRHAGKGFSRLENLNEHMRRVHTIVSTSGLGGGGGGSGMLGPVDSHSSGAPIITSNGTSGSPGALANLADLRPLTSVVDTPAMTAAAAAAAAAAVADVLPSVTLHVDGHEVDDDDDDDETGLGLLNTQTQAQMQQPRRRKRTASLMGGGDDGKYGDHDDLREEVKRVRQENEALRQQADTQNKRMLAMMKQIAELQQQQQMQMQQLKHE